MLAVVACTCAASTSSAHAATAVFGGTTKSSEPIVLKAGKTLATCTAAKTTWAASRRPGVIYGGSSAQGEPVVMRLDESRRRVSDFLFSWDASCQPDGALRIPDGLTGFAVSTVGAFGDT